MIHVIKSYFICKSLLLQSMNLYLKILQIYTNFFYIFTWGYFHLLLFFERERERNQCERENQCERSTGWLPSSTPRPGIWCPAGECTSGGCIACACGCNLHPKYTPWGWICKLSIRPDWESTLQPFSYRTTLQPLSHTSQGQIYTKFEWFRDLMKRTLRKDRKIGRLWTPIESGIPTPWHKVINHFNFLSP